jgi:cytochrome oxidase Cu insertion factor (SCO1/SenC/PrrC family)
MRVFACLGLLLAACENKSPAEREPAAAAPGARPTAAAAVEPTAVASVGSPAPDFELADLDGKKVSLKEFRGKTVVLEWFNPECPYVKLSHTKGSLVDTAKRHTEKGVV